MNISVKSEYALLAVFDLSLQPPGEPVKIADVARRHDLVPQHLWNWIRAARKGRFALPGDGQDAFVPVVSMGSGQGSEPGAGIGSRAIELMIGAVTVRVPPGAAARDIEAVLRAVWRSKS